MMNRLFQGIWINAGETMIPLVLESRPAPWLRKEFECGKFQKAVIRLCGLGFHELYVNGHKADDRVLAPNTTLFDRRASYIDYDVTTLLHSGLNAVAVLLGNGWYNCFNHSNEERAPWRDWPKLRCDILLDGVVIAKSDLSWKWHDSALVFDSLRCGELYDARRELPGVSLAGFDDSAWHPVGRAMSAGGELVPEDEEPCRVVQTLEPVDFAMIAPDRIVYDFGINIAGWCEIEVSGKAGAEVTLLHGEQRRTNGSVTVEEIGRITRGAPFQTDRYILKGEGREYYHPRFSCHGFRYAEVKIPPDAELHHIQAQVVRTAFRRTGEFTSSSAMLNTLQEITCRSYEGNFVGFPTDCPHREKNGWTGDAQLACRTGCWNYQTQKAYRHYLRMLTDVQRRNGQLPGFTPTAGWGYNWGSGPAYDSALFEISYQLRLFFNDTEILREMYASMRRYIDFCFDMEESDGILYFGLGDWCHPESAAMQSAELFSTAYYFQDVERLAKFAALLEKTADAASYTALAERIRQNFLAKFRHADGSFGNGGESALAAALYFGLAGGDAPHTATLLADAVRRHGHRANFGILGAKYVPRMLARYGCVDDAFEVITQPEFPGWGHWVKQGATTLRENWNEQDSLNHIMFGDISGWMYEVPGGIVPQEEGAGFRRFRLAPQFPQKLEHCRAVYDSVQGRITSEWLRCAEKIEYRFTVPEGGIAELHLPGTAPECVTGSGKRVFHFSTEAASKVP